MTQADILDVSSRIAKNCGRKRVEIDMNRISEIPLSDRTTIRDLSTTMNVGKARYLTVSDQGPLDDIQML